MLGSKHYVLYIIIAMRVFAVVFVAEIVVDIHLNYPSLQENRLNFRCSLSQFVILGRS